MIDDRKLFEFGHEAKYEDEIQCLVSFGYKIAKRSL